MDENFGHGDGRSRPFEIAWPQRLEERTRKTVKAWLGHASMPVIIDFLCWSKQTVAQSKFPSLGGVSSREAG